MDSDHVTPFCGSEHFDPTWFTKDAKELSQRDITTDSFSSDASLQGEKEVPCSSKSELEGELHVHVFCFPGYAPEGNMQILSHAIGDGWLFSRCVSQLYDLMFTPSSFLCVKKNCTLVNIHVFKYDCILPKCEFIWLMCSFHAKSYSSNL